MKIINKVINFYDYLILKRPFTSLFSALLAISFFSLSIQDFKMDASADSLVLENDQALKYFRATSARYSTEDFVVITFKPNNGIYNTESLTLLDNISKDIKSNISDVSSVLTILDVPLLDSPKVGFSDLSKEQRTLRSKNIDLSLVKQEFLTSPLYKNLLMSEDSTTTVIVVNFSKDEFCTSIILSEPCCFNSLRSSQLIERDVTLSFIFFPNALPYDRASRADFLNLLFSDSVYTNIAIFKLL